MSFKPIAPRVYALSLGIVNVFLLEAEAGLALIDTGVPDSAPKILAALEALGRRPEEIKHLLVTHLHADHTGSLAELKRQTGAPVYMHPLDAELVAKGVSARPVGPGPGLVNNLIYRLMTSRGLDSRIEPVETDNFLADGQELPIAGGLQVIHVPGHAAGQVAFLWPQHGGVLFAADAANNILRLGYSPIYEDLDLGRQSLHKLAGYSFETAGFGHGGAITRAAGERFKQRWGAL